MFTARVACPLNNGHAQVRLDSATGTLVGTLDVSNTGSWSTFTEQSTSLTGTSGTHDIYIVFIDGSGGGAGNFDWFKFSSGTGATPTPTPTAAPTATPPATPTPTTAPTPTPTGAPATITIQAESYDSQNGIYYPGGEYIGGCNTNDWVRYNNIDLGAGYSMFTARVACPLNNGHAQVRLDSTTGTLVGTLDVSNTGSWSTFTEQSTSLTGASGTHDIYIVFIDGSGGGAGNFDWFIFSGGT